MNDDGPKSDVPQLNPWHTVEFAHFVGVRHRNGGWSTIILKPSGQEIDVKTLGGRGVILHDNGIEFVGPTAPTDAQPVPLRASDAEGGEGDTP